MAFYRQDVILVNCKNLLITIFFCFGINSVLITAPAKKPKAKQTKTISPIGKIIPVNGDAVQTMPGEIINGKIVIPAKATVSISGACDFYENIELTDKTSVLRLDLQNKIKTNILLNDGTVILDNDLKFANDCTFLGDGTVDINSLRLKFSKGAFPAGKITYLNANDISLDGNTTVSSAQVFIGPGLSSDVNGFNFFWQFAPGGYVKVEANHTLYLVGLHMKGIGQGTSIVNPVIQIGQNAPFGFFDIHATSTIVMQNCTLDLSDNYLHDKGTIIFCGDNNKIIGHDFTFTTSGNAQFIVDGVSLIYDSLDAPNKNPFIFTNPIAQKKLLNNGLIRSTYTAPTLNIYSTTPIFTEHYFLTNNALLNFKNAAPATPKGILLDCHGHTICFPDSANALFNLDQNVTVTVTNALLHGYQKDVVGYVDASSKLVFGAGTKIHLVENASLASTDRALTFVGNAEMFGAGIRLELNNSNRIVVDNGSTLTLKNLSLVLKAADGIRCLDSNSKVVFENCRLYLDAAGFEWTNGNIDVSGFLEICGGDTTMVDAETTFAFYSSGIFKVNSGSNFILDRGIIFKYQPNISQDNGLLYSHKRHFRLVDPTSTFTLNGATLHSTTTACALDHGRLVVDDISKLIVDGNLFLGNEAELGSSLMVIIRPCAVFDIQGHVTYNKTIFS